ncbi:LLM class flavin-dependent oxidoreductase [Nonomuraea sp. NPDC004580]|uniref:LLM class flavin-dependent oxidoreductase n=1 Tax=Nonomuraea sp. NPDC004580 TaxID=3154552 RepID=UPI0033ABB2CA
MTDHPFRFGTVAGRAPDAGVWTGLARRAESLGYATLLAPDTLGTFSPFPALAAAAAATTSLRVGTYVLSRDALGVSYVTVNAQFMDAFAPVVERLAGT